MIVDEQALSEQSLKTLLEGTDIPVPKVYKSVTSTNILAKEAARDGALTWSCVAASHQSAGRGRLGRSFFSPDGSGIYFSVILRPEDDIIDMLTTTAAVAVCEAAENEFGVFPDIKWVNDVYLNSKKICGILTEASYNDTDIDYAVVGVGINLTVPQGGFPDSISDRAGSLLSIDEKNAANRMLAAFLKRFKALYGELGTNSKNVAAKYRRRCFVIGKEIDIIRSGTVVGTALAVDTDDRCRLAVRFSDKSEQILKSGEISVRVKD